MTNLKTVLNYKCRSPGETIQRRVPKTSYKWSELCKIHEMLQHFFTPVFEKEQNPTTTTRMKQPVSKHVFRE